MYQPAYPGLGLSADLLSLPPSSLPLEYLSLTGNSVSDLTPLAQCQALRLLYLGENPVRSGTVLSQLPNLRKLITGEEIPSRAADTLTGLHGLVELRLYSTSGINLLSFSVFQNLRHLDLYGCTVSHMEALAQLPALQYINLGETGLNARAPFSSFPALTELDLRNNSLSDLSCLLRCPYLELVILSESR